MSNDKLRDSIVSYVINSHHKTPTNLRFRSILRNHTVTVDPFPFSPLVAYEGFRYKVKNDTKFGLWPLAFIKVLISGGNLRLIAFNISSFDIRQSSFQKRGHPI